MDSGAWDERYAGTERVWSAEPNRFVVAELSDLQPGSAVMVAVFLTFALSGPLAPKEMGVILAVAVFLDALCIRLIILPVVLRLTGHAAWHTPRWLARILPHVRFAH